VNGVTAWFCVNVSVGIVCAAATERLIVRAKTLLAVALFVSVTVIVKVVAARVALGVPLIAPVDDERLNPKGRLGAMLYVSAPVPPPPATGVNAAAWFCVNASVGNAVVAAIAGLIVRLKEAVAVVLLASVTLTVKLNSPAVVGVPERTPALLKASPEGNAPADIAYV
jgi:hypothetical protein